MAKIRFDSTPEDHALIEQIAGRGVVLSAGAWKYQDAVMDITACHRNGCPLLLEKLLNADDFNFAHDVFGIRANMNRKTGKLNGLFLPRCANTKGGA
jgi:hypothetical protein